MQQRDVLDPLAGLEEEALECVPYNRDANVNWAFEDQAVRCDELRRKRTSKVQR